MKEKRAKEILVFLMLGALLAVALLSAQGEGARRLSYREFWALAEAGKVDSVRMSGGDFWQVTLESGEKATAPDPKGTDARERLLRLDIQVTDASAGTGAAWGLAAAGLLLLLLSRARGGAAGMARYAAVQGPAEIPAATFADVAVSPETLENMCDLVAFLQEPARFSACGARPPKGVLLYGPPGTGKTLLARALAGEAKAPFFAMNGADFVQVYVGVGASRVREVFKKARKAGGGVIFIDEIDAIGKKRDNGNDEREQTLNALLTEMSGFSGADGIIVLAATNRADTLDAALLREGRFDRRIEVGLPDYAQRLQILRVHARNKPLQPEIRLEDWARQTALFSGAQLEALLNEAAIRAARARRQAIEAEDLEAGYLAVTVGEERPQRLTPEEKRRVAYHEAGHAVTTRLLLPEAELTRVTILPSSRGAAGYSLSAQPEKTLYTRAELTGMLCVALGGRAAEELLGGREQITTGAANDWQKAREISGRMAGEWAMGETDDEETEKKRILRQAYEKTLDCLKTNRTALDALASALLEKETLRGEEINELLLT